MSTKVKSIKSGKVVVVDFLPKDIAKTYSRFLHSNGSEWMLTPVYIGKKRTPGIAIVEITAWQEEAKITPMRGEVRFIAPCNWKDIPLLSQTMETIKKGHIDVIYRN